MATQGTWGPQKGILGALNPFSRDYGFTEYNAPSLGVNPNVAPQAQSQWAGQQNAPYQQTLSGPVFNQAGTQSKINSTSSLGGNGGQVLGVNTLSGSQPQSQPQQQSDPFAGAQNSAQQQADAELQSALGEFDYQKENLQAQSGQLDQQRAGALSTLDTQFGQAQREAGTAKTEATQTTQTAKNKALSTAQDVQRQNRNVLRALGILSSSAAGEMLNKPINEYGTQAADLQQGLVDRIGKVENWLLDRQNEFTQAKTTLEQQYASLKDNISRDLRFNDRQRKDAVRAASAALSQRMADIQSQSMAYQDAAKKYSDNILLQVAQMKMYENPTADTQQILNTLLSNAQQGYQGNTASIYQGEDQKKKQSLLSG